MHQGYSTEKLQNDGWRREGPISNHDMAGGEVDTGHILAAVGHEEVERTANASAEQDGGTQHVNPFEEQVIQLFFLFFIASLWSFDFLSKQLIYTFFFPVTDQQAFSCNA